MKKSITQSNINEGGNEVLKESFVLWKNISSKNNEYLSGIATDDPSNTFKLIGYFNTNKKNPKEPDIRIYSLNDEGKQDSEVASLWESVSKNNNRYLTGTTNEKEHLIAFYGNTEDEKRPYIKAYYKNN